jgi:hypothetical protein
MGGGPVNHLLYPEDWVNQLRALNGGRKYMPGGSSQPMAQTPAAPTQKPAAAAARKPVTPPPSQVVDANPRTMLRRRRLRSATGAEFRGDVRRRLEPARRLRTPN